MQFKDIPGQESIKERLSGNAHSGRIPHAQLFLGPAGSANLALALAYAQMIACEDKRPDDSCGVCNSCNKFTKLIHPDLHFSFPVSGAGKISAEYMEEWRAMLAEHPYFDVHDWLLKIDSEGKQANITVSECRDIIRKLSLRSFENPHKFLILWLPEYLGKEGNTLLKIIEEPPASTYFFFVAHDQDDILPTVLSRTQIVKVARFDDDDIREFLAGNYELGEEQANSIAFLSEGNLREAITLIADEDTGYFSLFRQWLLTCYSARIPDMLKWVEGNSKLGRENLRHLFGYGIRLLRECLLFRSGLGDMLRVQGEEREFVEKFARIADEDALGKLVAELNEYSYYIERNANPRISLFSLSLRFKNILTSSKAVTAGHKSQ